MSSGIATTTNKPGYMSTPDASILVTGSSGLVGARLVEMLLERGAKKVVCFDVTPPDATLQKRFAVASQNNPDRLEFYSGVKGGNLIDKETVSKACRGIDIVYHIAALVGPFHDRNKYTAVNYNGTLNIISGCREHKVPKLVFSSSPSTRFHGGDITGQTEDELSFPSTYLQLYAESKAAAERAVTAACSEELLTVNVAPHQVYGPYDSLFLPNLLETAGNGRLRIFGKGGNKISVCYVDNYCHGLMCGADALFSGSVALGKFYIVTDGEPVLFWGMINDAVKAMGFTDLYTKFHLPVWFLMVLAHICDVVGVIIGKKFKLNPFNVKMLIIHRYFSIENAKRDLKYEPLFQFNDAWKSTVEWFKTNWLPGFWEKKGGKKKVI